MAGDVYTDGRRWGSQAGSAVVFEPADPVLLKPKAKPGASPYRSTSSSIAVPASSIKDNGTDIASQHSAYTSARHFNPLTLVGTISKAPKDNPSTFLGNYLPKLFHEGSKVVGHMTEAMTTSFHQAAQASVRLTNAVKVLNNLNADVAKEAGLESLDELKEGLTLEALVGVLGDVATGAVAAVATATVVGAGVGVAAGAKTVISTGQRVYAAGEQAAEITKEAQGILADLDDPNMDAKAMAKRIIKFLATSAGGMVLALVTKKASSILKQNKKQNVQTKQHEPASAATQCACASKAPVIIATGEKSLDQTDFTLSGPIPISWRRRYRSGDGRTDGWFGQGWSHPLATELWLQAQGLQYFDPQGRAVALPQIEVGAEHFEAYEQLTLARPSADQWELRFTNGQTHVFTRLIAGQWRLPLCQISDRNAQRIAIQYARADFGADFNAFATPPRPHYIHDSAGRQFALSWSGERQLLGVALVVAGDAQAPLPLTQYGYGPDASGSGLPNLLVQRNPAGQERRFEWQRHLLVGYTLANGQRHRNQYDQPLEQLDPSARVTLSEALDEGSGTGVGNRFAYNARVTWIEDFLGRRTAYAHDERQDIIAVRDALGQISETPFDSNGHPKGSTDPLGRSTSTVFDRRGNLTQLIDAAGHHTKIEYNVLDLPTRLTDAMGGIWLRQYDARGNLTTSTDPLGHSTHYEVDDRGQVLAITDAVGKRKHLQWDQAGNLTAYTDCSGHTTRFAYGPLGHLSHSTDALGQRTHYQFDPLGRLQQVTQPDGALHRYAWDGEGNLLAYTDPLGHVTHWRYNHSGDPLERLDALGQRLRYQYDAAGRLIGLTNEAGAVTQFHYDVLDRLSDEIGFDGRHQRYIYNAASELTHLIEAGGSDFGPGKLTHFERDALGRLTTKRHEGSASEAAVPVWQQPFNQAWAQVQASQHSRADATQAIDAVHASFAYDKLGRLSRASNALASVEFAYDPLGNLLSESQTLSLPQSQTQTQSEAQTQSPPEPKTYRFTHCYDALGNRISTTLPGGQTLNHLYYGSGHLHQINLDGQVISDFERDALHREVSRTQGSLLSQFAYDPAGRLQAQRVSTSAASTGQRDAYAGLTPQQRGSVKSHADIANLMRGVIERQYDYDGAGQLRQILDRQRGGTQYGYDDLGRITSSQIGLGKDWGALGTRLPGSKVAVAANESFGWDAACNPMPTSPPAPDPGRGQSPGQSQRQRSNTAASSVRTNRLEVWQDQRFVYDAHGNLIERIGGKRGSAAQTHTRFKWDQAHQLIEAEVTRGVDRGTDKALTQSYRYGYDALGRRVSKTDAFGTTTYLWDGDQMVLEQRGAKQTHTIYEPGSFVPLAQVHDGQLHHLHTDHLGTPLEASNDAGEMSWKVTYRTWGNVLVQEVEEIEQNLRFQGQYFDAETGLHYNRFRYYDPGVGRFVSQDPIGLNGGLNLFAYAPNPTAWIDPLGLAFGSGAGTHTANVSVTDAAGNVTNHGTFTSGNMTAAEKSLGFPQNTLATHTEARAVNQVPLKEGDSMKIEGQYKPCNSCKGKMNEAAKRSKATIVYEWVKDGTKQIWKAGGK